MTVFACADDPTDDLHPELRMAPEVEISTTYLKTAGQVTTIGVDDERWFGTGNFHDADGNGC